MEACMAATQSDVIGWLVGRLGWEDTLAALHERAAIARASDEVECSDRRDPVEAAPPTLRPRRAAGKLRSPVRGMSPCSFLLRIRP